MTRAYIKQFAPFCALAVIITLPWFLHPGYLLFLDWAGVPTPAIHLDATGGIAGMPIQILWVIASKITSSEFAQKLLIFFMLVLAGTTTYQLAKFLTKKSIASLCAGIFMMTNAFVFNRLQMGHIYLLYAYALTPYAIYLVLRFMQHPSSKKALLASMLCCAVILLSIHHIILLPILLFIFAWAFHEKKQYSRNQYMALFGSYIAVAIIILSVVYTNPTSSFKTLSTQDFAVFAPHALCTKSVVLDTVFLSSSWRNPQAIALPCSNKTIFYASNIILLGIMLFGAWKHKKLAVGALLLILLADVPFIPAMRDSAKYLADLALIEAILLAYGIVYIQKKIHNRVMPDPIRHPRRSFSGFRVKPGMTSFLIICVTLLSGSSIFFGLSNTIVPRTYPQSWYDFNQSLATLPEKPHVLFLPWHLYMPFDFTNNQTIGNPAPEFFTHATSIQSNNSEIQQLETTPLQTLIQAYHPDYVALTHGSPEEAVYRNALQQLPYLTQVTNSSGLTVWKFGE